MATQSTDSLVQNAACINNCVPLGSQWAVLIYLFAKVAGVTTDPNTLMQAAACINNCIPVGMQLPVLVYLATQITSGGGGGGGLVIITTSNPQGVTTGSQGQLIFNTNNNTLWLNTTGLINGWLQLI